MIRFLLYFFFLLFKTSSEAVILTEADIHNPIVVPLEEPVILRLHENPTTGYLWHFEISDAHILQKQKGHFESPDKTLVGAGGIREQSFLPQQEGTVIIRALYRRSWEKQAIHTVTYTLKIVQ